MDEPKEYVVWVRNTNGEILKSQACKKPEDRFSLFNRWMVQKQFDGQIVQVIERATGAVQTSTLVSFA